MCSPVCPLPVCSALLSPSLSLCAAGAVRCRSASAPALGTVRTHSDVRAENTLFLRCPREKRAKGPSSRSCFHLRRHGPRGESRSSRSLESTKDFSRWSGCVSTALVKPPPHPPPPPQAGGSAVFSLVKSKVKRMLVALVLLAQVSGPPLVKCCTFQNPTQFFHI